MLSRSQCVKINQIQPDECVFTYDVSENKKTMTIGNVIDYPIMKVRGQGKKIRYIVKLINSYNTIRRYRRQVITLQLTPSTGASTNGTSSTTSSSSLAGSGVENGSPPPAAP
eukprot:COSAG02_NODE_243_length_27457_cov_16.852328_10_plen_112_part_00